MPMKSDRKNVIGIACCAVAMFIAAPAIAQDLGYRWEHSTVGVRNLAPTFSAFFSAAGSEVTGATGLTFYGATANLDPPYSGHVAFQEVNIGTVPWFGEGMGYNVYGQPCANSSGLTGYCTMTSGADFALVRFNNANGPYSDYDKMNLIRHEFGHVLGMAHSAACLPPDGVMAISIRSCWPLYINYSNDELNLLDSWYP